MFTAIQTYVKTIQRYVTKYSLRNTLKEKISATILKSQLRTSPLINSELLHSLEEKYGTTISIESLPTTDGRTTKLLKVYQKDQTPAKSMVLCQGSNAVIDMHHIETSCRLVKDKDYSDYAVYTCQYVGAGEGKVTNYELKDITRSFIEFLKNVAKDHDPEPVLVKSISWGGAIATLGVSECHQAGYENIYLLAARTYRSFASVLVSRIPFFEIAYPFLKESVVYPLKLSLVYLDFNLMSVEYYFEIISLFFEKLITYPFELFLEYTGFNLKPAEHYLKIPEAFRCGYRAKDDPVVHEFASLVEDHRVRAQHMKNTCHTKQSNYLNIEFYQSRTIFQAKKDDGKNSHFTSEKNLHSIKDNDIAFSGKDFFDSYHKYIEQHASEYKKPRM